MRHKKGKYKPVRKGPLLTVKKYPASPPNIPPPPTKVIFHTKEDEIKWWMSYFNWDYEDFRNKDIKDAIHEHIQRREEMAGTCGAT